MPTSPSPSDSSLSYLSHRGAPNAVAGKGGGQDVALRRTAPRRRALMPPPPPDRAPGYTEVLRAQPMRRGALCLAHPALCQARPRPAPPWRAGQPVWATDAAAGHPAADPAVVLINSGDGIANTLVPLYLDAR